MATKAYDISTLLEGKYYRSLGRHKEGIIQYAEKRDNVWYGSDYQAYTVKVRPTYSGNGIFQNDFYATVAVKVGE
jgi:hypothetical protein